MIFTPVIQTGDYNTDIAIYGIIYVAIVVVGWYIGIALGKKIKADCRGKAIEQLERNQ